MSHRVKERNRPMTKPYTICAPTCRPAVGSDPCGVNARDAYRNIAMIRKICTNRATKAIGYRENSKIFFFDMSQKLTMRLCRSKAVRPVPRVTVSLIVADPLLSAQSALRDLEHLVS